MLKKILNNYLLSSIIYSLLWLVIIEITLLILRMPSGDQISIWRASHRHIWETWGAYGMPESLMFFILGIVLIFLINLFFHRHLKQ